MTGLEPIAWDGHGYGFTIVTSMLATTNNRQDLFFRPAPWPEDDDPSALQLETLDPSPWEWPLAPAGIEDQPAWQAPDSSSTTLPSSVSGPLMAKPLCRA